jgi:hypothetical protein
MNFMGRLFILLTGAVLGLAVSLALLPQEVAAAITSDPARVFALVGSHLGCFASIAIEWLEQFTVL